MPPSTLFAGSTVIAPAFCAFLTLER